MLQFAISSSVAMFLDIHWSSASESPEKLFADDTQMVNILLISAHCSLNVASYNPGQHSIGYWLDAWMQQFITWTSADL